MLRDGKPDRGIAFGAIWKKDARVSLRSCEGEYVKTGTGDMTLRMLCHNIPVRWISHPGADPVDLVRLPEPPR